MDYYFNWQLNNGGECLGLLLRVYTLSMECFFFKDPAGSPQKYYKKWKSKGTHTYN